MPVDYLRFQYVTVVLSDGSEGAFMGPALLEDGDSRYIVEVRACPPRDLASECPGAKYEPQLQHAIRMACKQTVKLQNSVIPDDIKLKD